MTVELVKKFSVFAGCSIGRIAISSDRPQGLGQSLVIAWFCFGIWGVGAGFIYRGLFHQLHSPYLREETADHESFDN